MSPMFWVTFRAGCGPWVSSSRKAFFAEAARLDEQEIVDEDAFVGEGLAVRWHRAGRHAADVGVMPACRHVEEDAVRVRVEHGHDDRYVGKMRATVVGIV